MLKMTSGGQAKTKLRLNTTPEDLVSIAHQLREIANFANKNETAEIDVITGSMVITFEYYPVKQNITVTAISSDDVMKNRLALNESVAVE